MAESVLLQPTTRIVHQNQRVIKRVLNSRNSTPGWNEASRLAVNRKVCRLNRRLRTLLSFDFELITRFDKYDDRFDKYFQNRRTQEKGTTHRRTPTGVLFESGLTPLLEVRSCRSDRKDSFSFLAGGTTRSEAPVAWSRRRLRCLSEKMALPRIRSPLRIGQRRGSPLPRSR
jgi:hypothetical protein